MRTLSGGTRQIRSTFHFDDVLTSFSTQEDVFKATLQPLVSQVLAGYETTAFAYGQTGTGKTYTMEGDLDSEQGRGLVPRMAQAIIDSLANGEYIESSVTVSYLEIYNEELSDLLAAAGQSPKLDLKDVGRGRGVCCLGLSEVPVNSAQEILELVRRAQERRRIAETSSHARSSRSHSIFTMKVHCRKKVAVGELENHGKLHLVDLAGSECAKKFVPVGSLTAWDGGLNEERERRNINQSLLTLGRVITALREGSVRVPYRDSKLTRLLQDALGGHCKTVIIATISPALSVVEETVSTLTYAEQAAGIRNRPVASSLLRTNQRLERSDPQSLGEGSGSSSGCGASDWAELELKVACLTQEVEDAQAALARKYQEAQDQAQRAEQAEVKVASLEEALGEATKSAELQAFACVRLEAIASERAEAANRLDAALVATTKHSKSIEERLASSDVLLEETRKKARALFEEAEQKSAPLGSELCSIHAEASTSVAALRNVHEDACSLARELQSTQQGLVERLASTLQTGRENAASSLTALAEGAKSALTAEAKQAGEALAAIEATAAAAAATVAQGGAGAAAMLAEGSQRLATRARAAREELAARRKAMAAAARRTNEALAVAAAAVAELSELAEKSMDAAEEAMTSLEVEVEGLAAAASEEVSGTTKAVQRSSIEAATEVLKLRDTTAENAAAEGLRWTKCLEARQKADEEAKAVSASILAAAAQASVCGLTAAADALQRGRFSEKAATAALESLRTTGLEALGSQVLALRRAVAEPPLAAAKAQAIPSLPDEAKRPTLQLTPVPSSEEMLEEFLAAKENNTVGNYEEPSFKSLTKGARRPSGATGKLVKAGKEGVIAPRRNGALKELNA